jgi:hypothetical protein
MKILSNPDTATGIKQAADKTFQRFGDKRDVASLAGDMSVRWVDGQLALGMPHMKFGARRVRFDLDEVRSWLKERYGQQRPSTIKIERNKARKNNTANIHTTEAIP